MEFDVKPGRVHRIASDERKIRDSLNRLNGDLEICRKNLNGCLSSSASSSINRSVNAVCSRMRTTAGKIGVMGDKLDTIAHQYSQAESDIAEDAATNERISTAKHYGVSENVKTGDFSFKQLLEFFGINGNMAEGATDVASLVANIMKKINGKSVTTVIGSAMAYGNDLWNLLYKSATGQIDMGTVFDLAKDGSGLWQGMYKFLDKNYVSDLNKSMPREFAVDTVLGYKFGNTIGYAGLIASAAGFFKNYNNAINGKYSSWQEMVGEWVGVGEKGVGVTEAAYNLSHMTNGVLSKSAKSKGGWFTLGEVMLGTSGQALKSYGKYNQDGKITVEEGSRIGIESSVSGLTTLISGVTLGIVNIDSDTASTALENWGIKKGTEIAQTISQNPEMADKFKNGNLVEQIGAFGWGVTKNKIDKDIDTAKNIYNFAKEAGTVIAEKTDVTNFYANAMNTIVKTVNEAISE